MKLMRPFSNKGMTLSWLHSCRLNMDDCFFFRKLWSHYLHMIHWKKNNLKRNSKDFAENKFKSLHVK